MRSVPSALGLALAIALASPVAAQVSGTVVDSVTRQPLADARVSLQASTVETTSDAAGAFSLPKLSGADLVIVAAKPGYFYGSAKVTAPISNVTLELVLPTDLDHAEHKPTPPDTCSTCHSNIFDEWKTSPMAAAGNNTWVHDVYNGGATAGGMGGFVYTRDSVLAKNNPASECGACHQPETWWSTPYVAMQPYGSTSPSVTHGVSCDVCHKIAAIDTSKTSFPGLWPSVVTLAKPGDGQQIMYGVLGDVAFAVPGSMRSAYNPQLRADICAACHQDKNDPDEDGDFEEDNGVVSEPTYQEWKDSPYSNPADPKYATCADCHMKPSESGQACQVLFPPLERPKGDVRRHTFPGTTAEFLDNAVSLAVTTRQTGLSLDVDVTVTNDQTGHHVPTGVTIRNMILLVEAFDGDGKPLASTGTQTVDALGGVGDPLQGNFAGLPGKLFAKVNGNVEGKGPTFFTDATSILWDNRIPALGSDTSHYRFALAGRDDKVRVRARLVYRRSWRALVDAKGWTTDGHGAPLEDLQAPNFGHLMEQSDQTIATCKSGPCATGCQVLGSTSDGGSLVAALLAIAGLGARKTRRRQERR